MLTLQNCIIFLLALAVHSEERLRSEQNLPHIDEKHPQNDYLPNHQAQDAWDSKEPTDQSRSARPRRRDSWNFLENENGYYSQGHGQNGNYPNYPYQQGYLPAQYPYNGPVQNPVNQRPFTYPDRYDYNRNSDRSQYFRSEGYRSFK